MTSTEMLNPMLYQRLVNRFGDVKIRNPGEARVVHRDPFSAEPKQVVRQWGETYYVQCPFCREQRFQLGISYMYGQRGDNGWPLTHLAYCHTNKCLAIPENRDALAAMLSVHDGFLEHARLDRGKEVSDEESVVALPTPLTLLDQLPRSHMARRYLRYRGCDDDRVGRYYGVSYCEDSDDSLARKSIIIPVSRHGQVRGWQAIPLRSSDPEPVAPGMSARYLTARGMHTSRLLYNLDNARRYETGILVREPLAVWAFGPMAVSLLGESVSAYQQELILSTFQRRSLVLLVHKDLVLPLTVQRLIPVLKQRMAGFAVVQTPPDLPFGSQRRKLLRAHVVREARAQGVRVSYEECESQSSPTG